MIMSTKLDKISNATTIEDLTNLIMPLDCLGYCYFSCTLWTSSLKETEQLPKKEPTSLICPYLTDTNRCSEHTKRPIICKLWGSVTNMKCSWGCKPKGEYLTTEEAQNLLKKSFEIGGGLSSPWIGKPCQICKKDIMNNILIHKECMQKLRDTAAVEFSERNKRIRKQ